MPSDFLDEIHLLPSRHHATQEERLEARQYLDFDSAAQVLREFTDIEKNGSDKQFTAAVEIAQHYAQGIANGTRDEYVDMFSSDFIFDGWTVAETIAYLTVELIEMPYQIF